VTVERRWEPLPDPEAVGEDEALVAAIRDEIARHGPITFARFMERALYDPGHGYYRRPAPAPGREGDFLTAPEAHPIFGAAIGSLVEEAWVALGRPDPFTVTEHGAGTGALALALLGGLRAARSPLAAAIRYHPVEIETARLEALRDRLEADGLAGTLAHGPGTVGAVVANEVLDALPVHRVVGRDGALRELFVGADDGGFTWVEGQPSTPALAVRLAAEAVTLAEGEITEICLALDGWLAGSTAALEHGVVVLVDYAAEPAELHGRARPTGTLRAFARQAVGSDPLRHVGRQDLTATVDLAALRAAAELGGLVPLGETTQAELLANAGTAALTAPFLRGDDLQAAIDLRSALARLMDPRGMGGYRVLVFGRGLDPGTRLAALRRVGPPA
jgi:SAM-dependent MidA family methyltransferase